MCFLCVVGPIVASVPSRRQPSLQSRPVKHHPWTAEEKRDVTEGLQRFFLLNKLPGKHDIKTSCPVALQTQTWRNINNCCRNTMTRHQRQGLLYLVVPLFNPRRNTGGFASQMRILTNLEYLSQKCTPV